MSKRAWISVSGLIWAMAGLMLLYKGLHILGELPSQEVATWWVAVALLVGFIKGRFILSRTVNRITSHIVALPEPIHFLEVYPKSYWILLSSMIGISVLIRMTPADVHGFIDVAVGSALLNGSLLYFRAAKSVGVETPTKN
jgi:hypothetical protein